MVCTLLAQLGSSSETLFWLRVDVAPSSSLFNDDSAAASVNCLTVAADAMIARVDQAAVLAASLEHKLHLDAAAQYHEQPPQHKDDEDAAAGLGRRSSSPSSTRQDRPDTLRRPDTYPPRSAVNNSTAPHSAVNNNNNNNHDPAATPTTTVTAAAATTTTNPNGSLVYPAPRSRNRSPLPRSHLRSRSHASSLAPTAPPIIRAHSLPTAHSTEAFPSPAASPALTPTSPLRSPSIDGPQSSAMASSPFHDGAIESISEDAELDLSSRSSFEHSNSLLPIHATLNSSRTLAVRRQRPSSPLHSLGSTPLPSYTSTPRSSSGPSSPSLASARFNEGFPTLHHVSSTSSFSSLSSTPSSARSRSPSISSLDTIEDAPDLEWEAIEADRLAKLNAVHEATEKASSGVPVRRGSLDIPGTRPGAGFGFGRRGADANRKRWSICGGERRADLDLETIWED
ncbi:hypothetical protein MBLNU459_g1020t2 [Dothideomycetes sp. NU459]